MYEDDKDKVRRNLMALSGFILASTYLGLKLPDKIFDVQLPRETNKVWVVVSIALAYVFWRFIHSEDVRKAWSRILSDYTHCRLKVYKSLIVRDLKRMFHDKPPRWINASPIKARLEGERSRSEFQYVRLTALAPDNTNIWSHKGFERRSGSTEVEIHFAYLYTPEIARSMNPTSHNVEQQATTSTAMLTFTFPRWLEFYANLTASLILLVRTELIPEVLVPCGMATYAGVIALLRALN